MSKIQFLVLTILLVCFRVEARSPSMSHDRFVYLTDSEQEQMIIKTMEFVVELEDRYQYEVTTYGYNENRYRHYTSIMKKVMSFLVEEAHADSYLARTKRITLQDDSLKPKVTPPSPLVLKQPRPTPKIPVTLTKPKKSWDDLADDFYNQINTKSSGKIPGKCIYAGWISEMRGNPALCVHPNFINPKSPGSIPETMSYATEDGCQGKNQITCNPVVFGYKSESNKSLFCVPAGVPESHNSALSCMKAALSEKQDGATDSKEKRLQHLRERLVAKPQAFANVQKFIYQYCVCEASPNGTNKSYHDRIRPHRTCFGMIEMVAETSICEEPKIDIDTAIFKKLRDAASSGQISKNSSGSSIDAFYKNFLGDVKKSNPTEYKALCPNDNMPEIIAKPKEEEVKPVVVKEEPKTKTYSCQQANCAVKATAAKPQEEEKSSTPPTEGDKPAAAGPASNISCMFKFVDEAGVAVDPDAMLETAPASREEKEIKVSASFAGKPQDFTCPIAYEDVKPDEPTKTPGIKLELKDKTDTTQKLIATATDREGLKIVWKRSGYKATKKEEPKKEESKIKVAGEEEEAKTEDKKPEEKKPEDGSEFLTENDDQTTITAPRISTDYTVCAQLVGEDKKSVAEDCKKVPKAADKKTPTGLPPVDRGMASPQQQMPGRMGNDTSAMGIR